MSPREREEQSILFLPQRSKITPAMGKIIPHCKMVQPYKESASQYIPRIFKIFRHFRPMIQIWKFVLNKCNQMCRKDLCKKTLRKALCSGKIKMTFAVLKNELKKIHKTKYYALIKKILKISK